VTAFDFAFKKEKERGCYYSLCAFSALVRVLKSNLATLIFGFCG
jgi:hypothetical protein